MFFYVRQHFLVCREIYTKRVVRHDELFQETLEIKLSLIFLSRMTHCWSASYDLDQREALRVKSSIQMINNGVRKYLFSGGGASLST